jgi:hypothetical protein
MRVDLAYTAFAQAEYVVEAEDETGATGYFVNRPNPGANKRVGVDPERSVVQRELRLTNRGRRLLLEDVPAIAGTRLPAAIELSAGSGRINLLLRVFPPAELRATVLIEGLRVDGIPTGVGLADIPRRGPVADVLRKSLGAMAALGDRRYAPAEQPSSVSTTHIVLPPGQGVRAFAEAHAHELVAMLIRADPTDLRADVVAKIIEDCAPLNEKHERAYTLVARAGILHLSAEGSTFQPDFRTLVELQAMARGVASFLGSFSARRPDAPLLYDFYLALVRDWVTTPRVAMDASTGSRRVWRRLVNVLGIAPLLEGVLTDRTRERLDALSDVFGPMREQYWLDANLSSALADEVDRQIGGPNLDFIGDHQLRQIVRRDLAEAEACLRTRAFKAATVLAGSVAEALLLAAILANGNSAKSEAALNKLGLADLIAEATATGVPVDDKTLRLMDNWLRHFRNLIHPGKERRESDPPTPDRARVAVQAVFMLAGELGAALT